MGLQSERIREVRWAWLRRGDPASQLSSITYKQGASTIGDLVYTYDSLARRTAVSGGYGRTALPPATTTNAVYNANNQLTSWSGTSLTYDDNGNLTANGGQTFTWNGRNQLTGTSGGSASFAYDGVGRRIQKTVSGTTTKFHYDGVNVVQELNASGSSSADLLTGLGLDQYFRRKVVGGASRDLLTDALGSTIALADTSGAIQTSYTYEPFGAPTISGTDTNPFLFTGREWDGSTGLQFNRARYYSPTFGRFVAEDPIGIGTGDPNLYLYGADSPTNLTDPLGLEPQEDDCGLLGIGCIDAREWVILGYDALAIAFSVAAVLSPQFAFAYFGVATIASLSAYALSIEKTFLLDKQPWNTQTQVATGLGFNNVFTPNVVYQFNRRLGLRSSVSFDVVQFLFDWAGFSQR